MKRFCVLLAFVLFAACGQTTTITLPDATQPPVQPDVESFAGTFAVRTANTHPFLVTRGNGQMTITLNTSGPPANVPIGVGLGVFANGACTVIGSVTVAPSLFPLLSAPADIGAYCLVVGDPGSLSGDTNYTITVTHY